MTQGSANHVISPWKRILPFDAPWEQSEESTSYHEAGHVIVGCAIGLIPSEAQVFAGGGGEVTWVPDETAGAPEAENLDVIEKQARLLVATMAYAGLQAEFIHLGVVPNDHVWRDDGDHKMASKHLSNSFPKWTLFAESQAQRMAREFLLKRRELLTRLACRLQSAGRMSTADIEAECGPANLCHTELLAGLPARLYA